MSKERLNLSISTRTKSRIDELSELTDASSSAEVIKSALLTYEALAKRLDSGELFFVERDGEFIPLDLMIDVPGRRAVPPKFKIVEGGAPPVPRVAIG